MNDPMTTTKPKTAARPLGAYLDVPPAVVDAAVARQSGAAGGNGAGDPAGGAASPSAVGAAAGPRLGEVLLDLQHITPDELHAALRRQRADRLGACALFAGVTPEQLVPLVDLVYEVSVPAGRVFIEQDTTGDCFYVIASGTVQVFGRGEGGDESPLALIGPGQAIGEMGYFTQGRRSASARAMEPAQLLALYYRDLPRCFELVPGLANGFLRTLTGRLNELNQQYHATAARSRATEQSLRNLSEYLDLSEHLSLGTGIEALIDRVVRTASRLLGADRASLFLLDPGTGELWSKVAQGAEVKEIRVPRGAGIAGWVAQHGETINIADAYEDPRFDQATDKRTGYRTRTILCGPVRNLAGDVIGVIQVINKRSGTFGDLDVQLFKAFAHQAAIAVENFNLYRRLTASHEKMAVMLDVATSVAQTLDLPALIRGICSKVTQVLGCDRSSYFVYDRGRGELWSMEATGSGLKEIRFPATAGLAGHTARTAEVVNIPDAYDDARFNRSFDAATGYRTRSVLCVPTLDRDGHVVGVTQAINKAAGAFAEDDVALLRALSSQIAVAVDNAQLFARTASMKTYLQSVQESISNAILTLDEGYRVVTANGAALKLLERPADSCVGRDLREVLGPGNEYLIGLVDKVYATGENTSTSDVDVHLQGGRTCSVNTTVVPLRGPDGGRQGVVVVLEDITREKRVKSLLVKKMSKDVVERLLSDPQMQKLGGRRGQATILFSDIREFTGLSEAANAEDVVELLNAYFTVMVDQVERHEGILDKFIGDAIMAVFGVPFPEPDDPVRAVRTALRMRDALERFNAARAARGVGAICIGIGVNTGEVVYGNIGSESRSDFTVIGDAVNLASRLEGLNKQYGTQILVSDFTRRELGDHFALREVDRVRVKGKLEPTELYEVLGERGYEPTPAQACFAAGLEAYRRRAFGEAIDLFTRGAHADAPCRAFVARCEELRDDPPPAGWDGVWVPKTK